MNLGVNSARIIAKLIDYSPNLCKVVLPRNQIGDEGAAILAKSITRS